MQLPTSEKMISFSSVRALVKKALEGAGIFDASETDWLIAETLGKKRTDIKLLKEVTIKQATQIEANTKRRTNHEPLSSIMGRINFYGLEFLINNDVLTPRQETEILVDEVLKHIQLVENATVLDLCTGSGCIGVCIAKKSNAVVTASDLSFKALATAKKNAKVNDVSIRFLQSDLFTEFLAEEKFDVIVCNPPYIESAEIAALDAEVRLYDSIMSLDGGLDGLDFYRKIAVECPQFLTENGLLFLEIGYKQAQSVKNLLQNNFKNIRIIKDFEGNDRVVISQLK